MTMNEELEQLLKNLKLRRILEIYDEQLRAAEKRGRFLHGVPPRSAARPVARAAGKRLGVAHPARQPARTLVAGNLSLRPPARRQPQADPRLRRTGVHRQSENIVFIGPTARRQNRTGFGHYAQGSGERLPLPVRPRAGSVRRNVCLAGRPLLPPTASNAWRVWTSLLIDELGYFNLKPEQSNIFFKLMEERYRRHSTIITQVEELTGQAGLQILSRAMILENEVTHRVGPPRRPNPTAGCVRWGKQPGYVVFGGQKIPLERPRVRTREGQEVELESYSQLQQDGKLQRAVRERMVAGLSTRNYRRAVESVLEGYGIKKEQREPAVRGGQ